MKATSNAGDCSRRNRSQMDCDADSDAEADPIDSDFTMLLPRRRNPPNPSNGASVSSQRSTRRRCYPFARRLEVAVTAQALLCLSLGVNVILLLSLTVYPSRRDNMPTPRTNVAQEQQKQLGWVRPKVIYGFVHMAKTAGTEINGKLAMAYERVCGNKGYSYDYYQTNERIREYDTQHATNETRKEKLTTVNLQDAVSKLYHHYNRGQPTSAFMNEIGYDDCDYIAFEARARRWKKITEQASWFTSYESGNANERLILELHVPCREPLNHLMSQCNFQHMEFDCEKAFSSNMNGSQHDTHQIPVFPSLGEQIHQCVAPFMDRLSNELVNDPNIRLKCFDPMPPQRYVDYMGTILQPKRIKGDYYHRDTNEPRDKEKECIWEAGEKLQQQVVEYMKENYPYYAFCDGCMGTIEELPLG